MRKLDYKIKGCIAIILAMPLLMMARPAALAAELFPITIVNNSRITKDNKVFVFIKAMQDNHDCVMQFDTSKKDGAAHCRAIGAGDGDLNLTRYSYPLTDFKKTSDHHYTIYLPQAYSGRLYVSLGYPMDFTVDPDTLKIPDPDGFKPRDVNYYKLYDKVEFTYNQYGVWMNPTAVDFFSLPLQISQPSSTSDVTSAGFSDARTTIINHVKQIFTAQDTTNNKIWQKLFLNYTHQDGTKTLLRLVAPGKAMVQGVPGTDTFDHNYLNNGGKNKNQYGFNYVDALWQYYKTHTLIIDCSELGKESPFFRGHVNANNAFEFSNGVQTVIIKKPTDSMPFFAGAGDSFDATNNTPKAIIIRELTSAFEVGLLPAKNNTILNKNYFEGQKNNYYQHNPLLPKSSKTQGPWYDLYSRALHDFSRQPIYTFAYDDALGQDGTLHDPSGTKPGKATLIIADMSGAHIPDPYTDTTVYTVMPIIGNHGVVTYQGKPLVSNQLLINVKIPFHVVVNGHPADIYIQHPIVKPFFKGADGIIINKTSADTATIIFPAKSN